MPRPVEKEELVKKGVMADPITGQGDCIDMSQERTYRSADPRFDAAMTLLENNRIGRVERGTFNSVYADVIDTESRRMRDSIDELAKAAVRLYWLQRGDIILTGTISRIITRVSPNRNDPVNPVVFIAKIKNDGKPYCTSSKLHSAETVKLVEQANERTLALLPKL